MVTEVTGASCQRRGNPGCPASSKSPSGVPFLGVEKMVIEKIEFDEDAELLVDQARPVRRAQDRCTWCQRRSAGLRRRRKYASVADELDLDTAPAVVEADAPPVTCREHGWSWRRCSGRGTARGSGQRRE